jgi:hypothetical protein
MGHEQVVMGESGDHVGADPIMLHPIWVNVPQPCIDQRPQSMSDQQTPEGVVKQLFSGLADVVLSVNKGTAWRHW